MRANTELPLITLTESRDSVPEGERERLRAGSAVLSNLTSPFIAVTSSAILHRGRQSHLCMEKSEGHLFLISFSLHSLIDPPEKRGLKSLIMRDKILDYAG